MSKTRARRNYLHNRRIIIEGIINNQHVPPANDIRYGFVKSSKHGSGWVSVYNILCLLTQNISPAKVVRSIEEINGTVFGGIRGTSYQNLISVLSEYGYMSKICDSKIHFDEVVHVGNTGILVYRNYENLFEWKFVAFRRTEENKYDFFNPTTQETSIQAFLKKRHALPSAKLIIVKNRMVK